MFFGVARLNRAIGELGAIGRNLILKLPTKVLAGVAVSALTVLLLPDNLLSTFGLATLHKDYQWALGLAVIIPTALLLVEGIVALFSWGKQELAAADKASSASRFVQDAIDFCAE